MPDGRLYFQGVHHKITPASLGNKYYFGAGGLELYTDPFSRTNGFVVHFDVWCPEELGEQDIRFLCRASLSVAEGKLKTLQVFKIRAPEELPDEFGESMIEMIEVSELVAPSNDIRE